MKNRYIIATLLNFLSTWQEADAEKSPPPKEGSHQDRPVPLQRSKRVGPWHLLEIHWSALDSPPVPLPPPNTPVSENTTPPGEDGG